MNLYVRPIPVKRALRFCAETHRRLPSLQGGMWAVASLRDGTTVGVAIVGRPTARHLDSDAPPLDALQVLRVACVEGDASARGHKGACSMLYGACARAARSMGAQDLFTYIHDDEGGVSLRAAGWLEDIAFTPGANGRALRALDARRLSQVRNDASSLLGRSPSPSPATRNYANTRPANAR